MSFGQRKEATQPAPFKERLRAWWAGNDNPAPVQHAAPARRPSTSRVVPMQREVIEPLAVWESPAMRIAQLAWGEGHSKPGGADFLLSLASPLGLDATKSLMEFGVGLGGGARALRRATGMWVTGYEIDGDLAHAAKQLSFRAGEQKGVEVACYLAHEFAPRNGSYDCVLSTDTLYRIEKKEDLLIKLENGLRHRGQMMITDFVLAPGVSAADQRLKSVAPGAADFWPATRYVRHFRERNLDLRVSEDITAAYRKLVMDGCKRFTESSPHMVAHAKAYPEALVAFLNVWAARVAAFESGVLKVMRFAVLKQNNMKLMSDW